MGESNGNSNVQAPLSHPDPTIFRRVLILALSRGSLDDLRATLLNAAYDPNTPNEDLGKLLESLESVGVDFSSECAALSNKELHHCVRCHRTYRDREDGPTACVILHQPAQAQGVSTYAYPCCGEPGPGPEGYDDSVCYHGWHTLNSEVVQYEQCNKVACQAGKCKVVPVSEA